MGSAEYIENSKLFRIYLDSIVYSVYFTELKKNWSQSKTDPSLGHRVDLSEIQAAVEKINGVEKAVVLCYKPNEPGQKVICFFTAKTFENDKVCF